MVLWEWGTRERKGKVVINREYTRNGKMHYHIGNQGMGERRAV
jgi:hypothetical protein